MNTYTYRFEIRVIGLRAEFTDDENTAVRAAFRMAEASNGIVTIVDNDAKAPVVARVANGFIQVLR